MRTTNQQALDRRIADFRSRFKPGALLLEYLHHDNVEVYSVRELPNAAWELMITLPVNVRETFGIEHDVLLYATRHNDVQPRVLDDIQRLLVRSERAEQDICLLTSSDAAVTRLLGQKPGQTAIVPLHIPDLERTERASFRELLSRHLVTINHFNVTKPISSKSAFFGRDQDLGEIIHLLERGQHVGVFGLRKAGKSSLLRQVLHVLRDAGWATAWIDLLEDPESLEAAISAGLSAPGRTLADVLDEIAPKGVVVVIDEIDEALPRRSQEASERIFSQLKRLRGLIQARSAMDKLSPVLLTAGVDPAIFSSAVLPANAESQAGTNPMYRFATVRYLQPMPREDVAAMLRALAKRMGMRLQGHEAIDLIFKLYGGHPMLSRLACSVVHERYRSKGVIPFHITREHIEQAAAVADEEAPRWHAAEIPKQFADWFPDEWRDVDALLRGSGDFDSERMRHAIQYGILWPDGRVRMSSLQAHSG